ncbi:MAG: AAA family ATPase [Chloroflexi bacterium]|nr:AAA family ATPase [Chloroflexota bacterium]
MLQQLRLENFKGLKKAQIDFGRITVLIGPNGTGKSSISQALMVLRQSLGSDMLQLNSLINLGTFEDVLNKFAGIRQIGIGVSVGVGTYPNLGINEPASYSYDALFNPRLTSLTAQIVGPGKEYFLAKLEERENQSSVTPTTIERASQSGSMLVITLTTNRTVGKPLVVGQTTGAAGAAGRAEVSAFVTEVSKLLSSLEIVIEKTFCVPATRGFDLPNYSLAEQPRTDFAPGQNAELASTFAYAGQDVKESISKWSESITGSPIAAPVIPGRNVAVTSYTVKEGIPVIGDGFGTNQLIRLLLTLATTPKQSIISIEEPEIHLHPKAQTKLCHILVEVAKNHDKQIVLTTHSKDVLFALVNAVKDGTLPQNELAIYCFEEKGKEPRRVEQDECGDIYDWDKNFFHWT